MHAATAPIALSCVILTRGDRPAELNRAIASLRAQSGDPIQVVLVLNGPSVVATPEGVDVIALEENLGIPAGRNVGTARATGDVVIHLDDDGWFPDTQVAERVRASFASDPELAVVTFRIQDPVTGTTERRHVPRLHVGDPGRSSEVTTFLGGACAIRRSVFEDCGGYPDQFFYGHEETDFAWRALNAGYRIRYDGSVVMNHPGGAAAERHSAYYFYNARNRVWLARRRLPAAVAIVYLLIWVVITVVREPRPGPLRKWYAGFVAGLRTDPGPRDPLSWRTMSRMARLGRPPVV
jgi:GT2 family glycosyltransferase